MPPSPLPSGAPTPRASTPPPLRVVRENDACHLQATQDLPAGYLLFHIEGDLAPRASRYSMQIDWETHIDISHSTPAETMAALHPWCFLNHSCEPNVRVKGREVSTLRPVLAGEQLAFDYATTEWAMAEPFQCLCRSPLCRGEIRGYKFLSTDERARLDAHAADYLKR